MQENPQVQTTPPLPGPTLVDQVNKAMRTVATDFSGDDDPAALAWPFSRWADTGTGRWRLRNAADSAWIDLGPLAEEEDPPVGGALFASQAWVSAQDFGQAASEASAGIVQLATAAEVLAGSNALKVVTPAALLAGLLGAATLSTSGYATIPVRLSSGGARAELIVQWGITGNVADGATAAVTFPIQFPTACFLAHATNRNNSAGGNFGGCTATTPTTSGCSVGHNNGGGNSSPIAWLAIGN
ncbi:gp53-like domain-containing protein [Achromobacter denitrificans]